MRERISWRDAFCLSGMLYCLEPGILSEPGVRGCWRELGRNLRGFDLFEGTLQGVDVADREHAHRHRVLEFVSADFAGVLEGGIGAVGGDQLLHLRSPSVSSFDGESYSTAIITVQP